MANKEYLNVNELATLFGLNVQTLHYYDKIGILKPSYRDPKNGYRKYRFDQTYKLASIRYMRKLGYSIEAVRDFQDTKSPDEALKRLKERSAAIHAQWEFGALLTDAVPKENAEIRTIPAGTYVVGYHKGAYEEIQDSFKRIKEWGRNLNLEDTILALNIIDQFVEQDNDNYSTRIEVRIADTK